MTSITLTNPPLERLLPAALTDLVARSLMAAIFLLAGLSKVSGYEGTQAYMASVGLPGVLLPAVIALEIGGAAALITGFMTRLSALALALFSIASGLLFHFELADQTQFVMFFKNLAMAGGLLVLANQRPGPWTIDRRLGA